MSAHKFSFYVREAFEGFTGKDHAYTENNKSNINKAQEMGFLDYDVLDVEVRKKSIQQKIKLHMELILRLNEKIFSLSRKYENEGVMPWWIYGSFGDFIECERPDIY